MKKWASRKAQRDQLVLFEEKLDNAIESGSQVRQLDAILDQLDWSALESTYNGVVGQPAIHPRLVVSCLIYGMLNGIRASRKLELSLQMRLDFRWLTFGQEIDHSTIAKFRVEKSDQIADLFVQVALVAQQLGWSNFSRVCFDGTTIRANNRRTGTRTRETLEQDREKLDLQAKQLREKYQQFNTRAIADDVESQEQFSDTDASDVAQELADVERLGARVNAALTELNACQETGLPEPKRIPITDPNARLSRSKNNGFDVNHTATVLCDQETGMIGAVLVVDKSSEDKQLPKSVEHFEQSTGHKIEEVLGDTAFETGQNLQYCDDNDIQLITPAPKNDPASNPAQREDLSTPVAPSDFDQLPVVKVTVKGEKVVRLSKDAFIYDKQEDVYYCPQGKALSHRSTGQETRKGVTRVRHTYAIDAEHCVDCPLAQLCQNRRDGSRKLVVDEHEELRRAHRQQMSTEQFKEAYKGRQSPGERPFALMKHALGIRQLLTRGTERVQSEFNLAALAINVLLMIGLMKRNEKPP